MNKTTRPFRFIVRRHWTGRLFVLDLAGVQRPAETKSLPAAAKLARQFDALAEARILKTFKPETVEFSPRESFSLRGQFFGRFTYPPAQPANLSRRITNTHAGGGALRRRPSLGLSRPDPAPSDPAGNFFRKPEEAN